MARREVWSGELAVGGVMEAELWIAEDSGQRDLARLAEGGWQGRLGEENSGGGPSCQVDPEV